MEDCKEQEDCSQQEKEWIVSDMIRSILRDAGCVDKEDFSLEFRKINRLESVRTKKSPNKLNERRPVSVMPRSSKPVNGPATGSKSVIFETLCVPIFRESDNTMVPWGIMSPSAGNYRFDLNDIGRIVSIPAVKIRQLLLDDIDNIALWPSGDDLQTVYALMQVDRQLLLDADVNA